ncbi:tRNA pseudouridine(55) synthase TruB [Planctellipticum variicoloris]|uniref:tRNA pseudouridine(55) synthase TruB n=1 Tax=Planctellipticum variicoloris TaxID=3064265 RepID=UPI0030136442|nr:tRNA pseudouridine(55) synthase TruB [Planctomycetaceae bacterium SH412]
MPPLPPLSGLLNVHKPEGWTSRDVVNRVQRLVRPAKVGHAGTLDPLATGVLVVCIGSATRLISFVQDSPKRYRGRFRLGLSSDTEDITGNVTVRGDAGPIRRADLESLLPEFTGEILQRPPAYSALHVAGQRAYDLARAGQAVDLAPRPVRIDRLHLSDFALPDFELEITCGSGTYVRSLGRDLGERLGCGAVMTALVREAVGAFELSSAIAADPLDLDAIKAALAPCRAAVAHLPSVTIPADALLALRQGKPLAAAPPERSEIGRQVAILSEAGDLLGIAERLPDPDRLQPRIVLAG